MTIEKPIIICLTPVKNEEWILERFLKATSLWADHIIIADQGSTDKSVEIAKQFPKVILTENPQQDYNEYSRQQILLKRAREIPGRKLLIALDTDEFFSANAFTSPEWQTMLHAEPGTIIRINWIHPLPRFWMAAEDIRNDYFIGYMDNGDEMKIQDAIHNPRLPFPLKSKQIYLNSIKLLHYNLVDFNRDRSKKQWYMCWELIKKPANAFYINRNYIHHHPLGKPIPFNPAWIKAYEDAGIDMTSVTKTSGVWEIPHKGATGPKWEDRYWWDEEILSWMKTYGSEKFSKLDIWDKDWEMIGKIRFGSEANFKRRASLKTKMILRFIRSTPDFKNKLLLRWLHRWMQRIF